MPPLWDITIEAHRQAVRQAILNATWALVSQDGLLSVTMSRIAEEAGVGRATLYKYFPDIKSILAAWHEHHTAEHLSQLTELANRSGEPMDRLHAVLEAYARTARQRGSHAPELVSVLHEGEQFRRAQQRLVALIGDLLSAAVAQGQVRDDVPTGELASYCLHALTAADDLASETSLTRLVDVTLDGARPRL